MNVNAKGLLLFGAAAATLLVVAAYPKFGGKDGDQDVVWIKGSLEQETIRVISQAGGLVKEVRARQGDQVAAGNVLLQLQNNELSSTIDRLRKLRARAASAMKVAAAVASLPPSVQRQLAELNPAVRAAEDAYVDALGASERSNNAHTQEALRAAGRRRETTRADAARSAREAETASAGLATDLQETLHTLESEIGDGAIRAPMAGIVDIFELLPGDLVLPGQPVATLALPSRFYVDVWVGPQQLGMFAEGRAVRLRISSVDCAGSVRHVARKMDSSVFLSMTKSSFAVRIDVLSPPGDAQAGMPVEVGLGRGAR